MIIIIAAKETHISRELAVSENIPKAAPLLQTKVIWKAFFIMGMESPGLRFSRIINLVSWSTINNGRIIKKTGIQ